MYVQIAILLVKLTDSYFKRSYWYGFVSTIQVNSISRVLRGNVNLRHIVYLLHSMTCHSFALGHTLCNSKLYQNSVINHCLFTLIYLELVFTTRCYA